MAALVTSAAVAMEKKRGLDRNHDRDHGPRLTAVLSSGTTTENTAFAPRNKTEGQEPSDVEFGQLRARRQGNASSVTGLFSNPLWSTTAAQPR